METPKNTSSLHTRKHTPKLSERKKKLFLEKADEALNDFGLSPLDDDNNTITTSKVERLEQDICPTNIETEQGLETGAEEQLQKLFNDSMDLDADQQTGESKALKRQHNVVQSPNRSPKTKRAKNNTSLCISTRRFYKTSPESNQKRNLFGSDGNVAKDVNISMNSKVGSRRFPTNSNNRGINRGVRHKIRKVSQHHIPPLDINRILKNVRNERLQNIIRTERERKMQIEVVHTILRSNKNPIDMARPLTVLFNANDNNNNEENIPSSRKASSADFSDIESDSESDDGLPSDIYKDQKFKSSAELEPSELQINHTKDDVAINKTHLTNRKFFKSGYTANMRKEIQITGNIKATVKKGKILLKEHKKIRRPKLKTQNTECSGFSEEQATVKKILENLNDTTYGDMETSSATSSLNNNKETMHNDAQIEETLGERIPSTKHTQNFEKYRQRLPYQTDDPVKIEQQHLLLDFLISNNICTEENFNIFIADPDSHKEEAARIVDNLVEVVHEQNNDFRGRIPYKTNIPEVITQQHKHLDFLIENNICTEETFDIFIANYRTRRAEAETIINSLVLNSSLIKQTTPMKMNSTKEKQNVKHSTQNNTIEKNVNASNELFPIFYQGRCQPLAQKSSRSIQRGWIGGEGSNQYQIDAGQKKFGAQQCKQCGLVYTVHEPEEEKLHRFYHASQHIMRFKTWINEDVVGYYPEWGSNDGRIIRVTDNSHIKRQERLKEVLEVVDKELGFSSYIIPNIFVGFLAICRNQIVGLCLVQPLKTANKFICINGVDCCTEEEFEAKCGISRIWVSPLHRRMYIASKMLQAVQLNTIVGEEIPLCKIAFSAPTQSGKLFAQKATKMENFLIYQ